MYSDENYNRHNIFGLNVFSKEKSTTTQNYIKHIVSSESIYKALGDVITFYFNEKYFYLVDDESYHILFDESINPDQLIALNPASSESENFVLKVFNEYKFRTSEKLIEKKGIAVDREFRFDL